MDKKSASLANINKLTLNQLIKISQDEHESVCMRSFAKALINDYRSNKLDTLKYLNEWLFMWRNK